MPHTWHEAEPGLDTVSWLLAVQETMRGSQICQMRKYRWAGVLVPRRAGHRGRAHCFQSPAGPWRARNTGSGAES